MTADKRLEVPTELFDTGDYVKHAPSGESWVVACVDGEDLYWCGWPPGRARVTDCVLIRKATPEYRKELLHELASMLTDDHRKRHAARILELQP